MRSLRARVPTFLLAALSVSIALHATHAAAQPTSAPASKDVGGDPVRLFEEGVAAAKAEDWPKAREAFLRAWELKQHWQIAANLGRAEFMLKRHCDAVDHLTYFLNEAEGLSASDRQQTQEMLNKALSKVGRVRVQVDVSGADVLVDEKPVGRSPLKNGVCVEPGRRVIEARQEGGEPARESIEMKAGSTKSVELRLSPESSPSSSQSREDGQAKEKGNGSGASSGSGAKMFVLGVGGTVTAVGLGLGVGSVVYAMSAKSRRDDNRESRCSNDDVGFCRREFESGKRDHEVFSNLALWSFLAAGIGGVATTVSWFVMPGSKPHQVSAAVSLGPHGGALTVTSSW